MTSVPKVTKLFLHDFAIGPSIDCRDCKKGEHTCVLEVARSQTPPVWCLGMETVGQVLGTAYDPRDMLGDEQAVEWVAALGKAL